MHRHSGYKIFFHSGIQDRRLVVIPGIHYFDAHRIQPLLVNSLEHQIDLRSMKLTGPEGAGDTVNDPSSDEEEVSTDAESDQEDPTVAWCPPIPDAAEDPSEDEIASAADKLAILISHVQPSGNPFCISENLGALPPLWLQARLTLSLTAIQREVCTHLIECCQRAVVARATSHCGGCPSTSCKGSHNSISREEASPGAEFIDAIG